MAGKKTRKVHRIDRNKMSGPMTEFFRIKNPEGAEEMGVIATFENNKYGVFLKKTMSDAFSVPGPDGRPQPMEVIHLIIARHDRKKIEIPWAEKQAIKSELLSGMAEGVELFPSEMRRMGQIADHQAHLWVLPPGATFPIGMIPKAMQELQREDALEKFTVSAEELDVFVIKDGDVTQVFGSLAEAASSYEEAGNAMPDGDVGRIGSVPTEEEGAVWSNMAKVKIGNILEKASMLERLLGGIPDEDPSENRINTNGPENDQDELENEMGVVDESPNGDEENVMMPEFMAMGVEEMKRKRIASVSSAVDTLEQRMIDQQKSDEEVEKDAEKEAKSEEEAKNDLDEMREKMRKDRESQKK